MIPGLAAAEFARLGGLHRNTFINSPKLLDRGLRLEAQPRLRFAGQITGVEGYVESAAIGLLAGRFAAAERLGRPISAPPATTALGALLDHITGGHIGADPSGERHHPPSFQPMNINYGLLPPLDAPATDANGRRLKGKERGFARKRAMSERALADLAAWLQTAPRL
jgi:methylenetetrahydrofolate--tRNA-(uracil-5-)-methyltransferase